MSGARLSLPSICLSGNGFPNLTRALSVDSPTYGLCAGTRPCATRASTSFSDFPEKRKKSNDTSRGNQEDILQVQSENEGSPSTYQQRSERRARSSPTNALGSLDIRSPYSQPQRTAGTSVPTPSSKCCGCESSDESVPGISGRPYLSPKALGGGIRADSSSSHLTSLGDIQEELDNALSGWSHGRDKKKSPRKPSGYQSKYNPTPQVLLDEEEDDMMDETQLESMDWMPAVPPFIAHGEHASSLAGFKAQDVQAVERGATEEYYRKALEADPGNTLVMRNFARFLIQVNADYDGAEECLRKAIIAGPGEAETLVQYAKLMWDVYHDADKAVTYFEKAVQAAPEDCYVLAAYASFLWRVEASTLPGRTQPPPAFSLPARA